MRNVNGQRPSRWGTTYLRILLCFLSFLIPIAAGGVLSYYHAESFARTEFVARIGTNLASSAEMIELALKTAEATCYGFFSDPAIAEGLKPAREHSLEGLESRRHIPRVLLKEENAISPYAHIVFAYVDDSAVWTSGGMTEFDFFFGSVYKYDGYDARFFRERLTQTKEIVVFPASGTSGALMKDQARVVPIVMHGKMSERSATLVLNVSTESIERTLRGSSIFPSTSFVVLAEDGSAILRDDGALGSWPETDEDVRPGQDYAATVAGRKSLVSCWSAGTSGWTYLAVTPLSSLEALERSILGVLIVVLGVLTLMSLVFAFIFSSVIYNPIRTIRDILSAEPACRGTRRVKRTDDFAAIRRGVEGLKAEEEKTRKRADAWTREYVENAFRFILRGHRIGGEAVLREALETEYRFSGRGYACAAVILNFGNGWYERVQDTDRIRVSDGVVRVLRESVLDKVRAVALEFRQDRLALIADLDGPETLGPYEEALEGALKTFEFEGEDYSITVGVGGYRSGLDELSGSWNEAMTAVAGADLKRRFQVVRAADGAERPALFTPLDEQALLNALKEGDSARLEAQVASLFAANEARGASWSSLRALRDDVVACGLRFLAERGGVLPSGAERAADGPDAGVGPEELRRDAAEHLARIAELASAPAQTGNCRGGLAAAIASYLETHYDRGLCLERIADELGLSTKYVSKVFKEEMGENITDRVDRIRAEKAKELLLSTDTPVADIARAVGVDSRATFLRLFHRTEGMTPSEYRSRFGRPGA